MHQHCHHCRNPFYAPDSFIEISYDHCTPRGRPAKFIRFHIKCFQVIAGDEYLAALGAGRYADRKDWNYEEYLRQALEEDKAFIVKTLKDTQK